MYKTLLTLLASTFFTATAIAADESTFKTLDQNGDDAISAEEAAYSERLTEDWKKIDVNQDSVVDRAEFSAFEAMAPKSRND